MQRILSTVAALAFAGVCMAAPLDLDIQKKIQGIEKGLVPFTSGAPGQSSKGATLEERMAHFKVPGVSIALIQGNKLAWVKGYGTLQAGGEVSVNPESLFQAGSTTKMLVAATALRLVDKGVLDLDRDVNTYLKSWKVPDNEFTNEKKVTLRLLLSHRAGLPCTNFGCDPGKTPTMVQVMEGLAPARNKPAQVASTPGAKWEYSNVGYTLVQLLLEDVTGKPLQQLMEETLFRPLKMSSSTLDYYRMPADSRAREAMPHDKEGRMGRPMMHPTALAQGGLMTTPSDLARFVIETMRAYRGESGSLLSKATVKAMFHSAVELDPKLLGDPLGQCLGVFVNGQDLDLSFVHPGYNIPGSTCWASGMPGKGNGLVVMANGAEGHTLAKEILAAAGMAFQKSPMAITGEKSSASKVAEAPAQAAEGLSSYLGRYEFNPSTVMTISVTGKQVFAEITGRPNPFEIFPAGKDTFNVPGMGITVEFLRESEAVTGLRFSRNDKVNLAKKVK